MQAFVNTPQAGARHPTPGGVLPMPPSMQPQEGSSSAKHPASGFPQVRLDLAPAHEHAVLL